MSPEGFGIRKVSRVDADFLDKFRRLKGRIGAEMNIPSYLIDDATCLDPAWLEGKKLIGVTAGASAPEALVDELIARLKELGAEGVEMLDGLIENVQFKLPSQVRNVERPAA